MRIRGLLKFFLRANKCKICAAAPKLLWTLIQ